MPVAALKLNVGLLIVMPVPAFFDANVPPVTASVSDSVNTSPVTAPPVSDAPPNAVVPS